MPSIFYVLCPELKRTANLGASVFEWPAAKRYIISLIALSFVCSVSSALANEVMLKLNSGTLTISGKLIGFDGQNYLVVTDFLGVVKVDSEKFSCIEGVCPKVSIGHAAISDDGVLRIRGSRTMGSDLIPALIRDYAASIGASFDIAEKEADSLTFQLSAKDGTKFASIDLQRRGSGTAFPALASGEADIGMADRSITDEEIGALAAAGFPQMNRPGHEHVVGLDGIAVIVSSKNPINALSLVDLSRIFSGEAKDWSEFKLPRGKINVYSAGETTGDFRTFWSFVLKPFSRSLSPNADTAKSHADLAAAVENDAAGIGFASLSLLGSAKPLAIRDVCGLTHKPSAFNVKSGEFPLARNLYFYTTNIVKSHTNAFLRYALSPDAADALKTAGFSDGSIITEPFDTFRDRVFSSLSAPPEDFDLDLMRQLIKGLGSGERLSATMRFESSSAQLDSESVQQLPRVVEYLKSRDLKNEKVVIAGFSDSSGLFANNRELALRRAATVRDAILVTADFRLDMKNLEIQSFGEIFPAACNDTDVGREKNRRVEIWVVPQARTRPVVLSRQP